MNNKSLRPPLLAPERIKFVKKIESKKRAFDALTELLKKGQSDVSKTEIFDALIAREKLGNTYIGNGIAIPRAHLEITNARAAMLVIKKGLKLNSADKLEITIFLGILIPENSNEMYSKVLTRFTHKMQKYHKLNKIIDSANPELITSSIEGLFELDKH